MAIKASALVAIKLLIKGKGLYAAAVAAGSLFILSYMVRTEQMPLLLISASLITAASSIVSDHFRHMRAFYALVIVGASPKDIKTYAVVTASALSLLLSVSIILWGFSYVVITFVLDFSVAYASLYMLYLSVRKQLVAVTI
jgi:hypothetical protein